MDRQRKRTKKEKKKKKHRKREKERRGRRSRVVNELRENTWDRNGGEKKKKKGRVKMKREGKRREGARNKCMFFLRPTLSGCSRRLFCFGTDNVPRDVPFSLSSARYLSPPRGAEFITSLSSVCVILFSASSSFLVRGENCASISDITNSRSPRCVLRDFSFRVRDSRGSKNV